MSNEEKKDHIEVFSTGLKCDNPACDWRDESITVDNYKDYLNHPCPKCGQNVLTQEDLENVQLLMASLKMVNSLSLEDMQLMKSRIDPNYMPPFDGAKGAELLKEPDGDILISVDTHKDIKIVEFKKV